MSRASSNLFAFPRPLGESAPSAPAKGMIARILRAGYIGEIIRDELDSEPLFHWLVQRCESGEVLALGQARSLAEAELSATSFLDDLRLRRVI